MQKEKMIEVFEGYQELFADKGIKAHQCPDYDKLASKLGEQAVLGHLAYMAETAIGFVQEGRIEKANRWLGFIQGVLFASNNFAINSLCKHNRPDR